MKTNFDYELFGERKVAEIKNSILMTKKTIEEVEQRGGNTEILEEDVKQKERELADWSEAVKNKDIQRLVELYYEEPMIPLFGGEKRREQPTDFLVKSNDFKVYFDTAPIDGKFVVGISYDDLIIHVNMYDYIIKDGDNIYTLEKVLNDNLGNKDIGNLTLQKWNSVGDVMTIFKNCKIDMIYVGTFDIADANPRVISFDLICESHDTTISTDKQ